MYVDLFLVYFFMYVFKVLKLELFKGNKIIIFLWKYKKKNLNVL